MSTTGSTHRAKMGSAAARRTRKRKLLRDPAWGGTGFVVGCVHCGLPVFWHTLDQDRIDPELGYAYTNLQPSCAHCNRSRGNRRDWSTSRLRPLPASALATA